MLNHSKKSEENVSEEQKVSGYGGYAARHEYEKSRAKKKPAVLILQVVLLVVLAAFSCLGVISLIRGDFVPNAKGGGSGTIKVPTQNELSDAARDVETMLGKVELSLITVAVEDEEGAYRYGTGFVVDDAGYAVCSSLLLTAESGTKNVTAYTTDGVSLAAEVKGMDRDLGIALIRLPREYQYTPISVENSFFVERGETLYAVGAYKTGAFYGTVARGLVGSVGPSVQFGSEGIHANMIYLDIDCNETLYGAPVVDSTGAAIGFMSGTLSPLYDSLAPVIPINIVYTVINDFWAQG